MSPTSTFCGPTSAFYGTPQRESRQRYTATTSPALRVPAVQARRAAVHDHDRLGIALVAHRRAGREAGALAGHFDVLAARGVADARLGEQLAEAYVRVFF